MRALIQDLRYASRALLHSPAFSVSVILVLALGVGASASIFNLVDAYFLRSPPGVSDPGRLVDVRGTRGEKRVGSAVSLLLIATTLVASHLPARQATRVDPMTVMRAE
jgi:hypothetical protein